MILQSRLYETMPQGTFEKSVPDVLIFPDNRAILSSKFTVRSGMKGHFLFDMVVSDGKQH
jgi:hypothetical protein